MSEYSFPILQLDDIVQSLGFVTEGDFKKPEPARWYKIYAIIFESLTDEKPENGEEKAIVMFPKYCNADNPELFEDASRILWFTLVMQQLFHHCGINDFSFKDIRDPRPKRCMVLCSAVVNFLRFKLNREPVIDSVLEQVERYKLQHEKVTKTNNELKKRIAVEMAQHPERESRIQQLQERISTTTDNMSLVQAESQRLLAKISEKKMKISESRAQRDNLKYEIIQIRQECEKLQRNIVQSPQKVKAKLGGMQDKVESLKQTKAEKVELVSNRRQQLDQLKTRNGIVEQGIRFMESMLEDIENRKAIEEEIKVIKESRQMNIPKLKRIKMHEEELVESISLLQDRTQKLQLQKRTRAADLDACFTQITEKKKQTMCKIDALKAEKETLQREKETWVEKIESIQNKCAEKTDTILDQYSHILESLDQYHFLLQDKIQSASASA